jgi:hypothetical protein
VHTRGRYQHSSACALSDALCSLHCTAMRCDGDGAHLTRSYAPSLRPRGTRRPSSIRHCRSSHLDIRVCAALTVRLHSSPIDSVRITLIGLCVAPSQHHQTRHTHTDARTLDHRERTELAHEVGIRHRGHRNESRLCRSMDRAPPTRSAIGATTVIHSSHVVLHSSPLVHSLLRSNFCSALHIRA